MTGTDESSNTNVGRDRYDRPWRNQAGQDSQKSWEQANGGADMFQWKSAMLLLGQDKWIHRRVEAVSFTDIGTTRRRISFDFSVPQDKFLYWNCDGGQRMVAVPLTFLGNGDLIHMDAVTASGESVPIMGLTDNQEVSRAALHYCFNQIPHHEEILADCNQRWKSLRLDFLSRHPSGRPDEPANPSASIDKQIRKWSCVQAAIDACIRKTSDEKSDGGIRTRQRLISRLIKLLRWKIKPGDTDATAPRHHRATVTQQNRRYVHKNDYAVEALMDAFETYILKYLPDVPAPGAPLEKQEQEKGPCANKFQAKWWMTAVESFLLLLSTVLDTHIVLALVPEDYARQRAIIKLSFDSGYVEDRHRKYMSPNSEQLDFMFQTMSARSTHIEINPVAGGDIGKVEWDVNHCQQKTEQASIVAGRFHFSATPAKHIPLLKLRVTLVNQLSTILANCGWSVLCTIIAIANCVYSWMPIDKWTTYFELSDILAALALLYTLWVARRINSMDHAVSQELSRYPNLLISANLTIATISCLVCGLASKPNKTDAMNPLALTLTIIALVSLAISIVIVLGLWQWFILRFKGIPTGTGNKRVCFLVGNGDFDLPQINVPAKRDDHNDALPQKERNRSRREQWKNDRDNTRNAIRVAKEASETAHQNTDSPQSTDTQAPSDKQRLQALLPSEHGPYAIMSDSSVKTYVLEDKSFFVGELWNSVPKDIRHRES